MSPCVHIFGIFLGAGLIIYAAKTGSWWLITAGWFVFGIAAFRLGLSI